MAQREQNADVGIQFHIQRIYIKEIFFKVYDSPKLFLMKWEPNLLVSFDVSHTDLKNGSYEVVLLITAGIEIEEKKVFSMQVKQAGIFSIEGAKENSDNLSYLLHVYFPSLLFPHASEVVTSLVIRASLPQLVLSPVNFEKLYQDKVDSGGS